MDGGKILVVGGYGEVGRRLAALLESAQRGRVIVAGRHPEHAKGLPARKIDVDDVVSIDRGLDDIEVVVVCIRQREPHVLRAAIHRGIAYTSIAPPQVSWAALEPLRVEAQQTGARIVLGAGLSPGITSVLVRSAADRLDRVDSVETALLLSVGDTYGSDSMAFILDEISRPYPVVVDGVEHTWNAFERPRPVAFPAPLGERIAYTMPFTDQLYYPSTVGAKTAIARLALDPPWLTPAISVLLRAGLRRRLRRGGGAAMRRLVERLRRRYAGRDFYGLVVDVRGARGMIRSTLVGRGQATVTAAGAAAITEALFAREMSEPGVWLAEQVIRPEPFLTRLRAQGIVPATRCF